MRVKHVTVEKRGTSHLLLVFVRRRALYDVGHPCIGLVDSGSHSVVDMCCVSSHRVGSFLGTNKMVQ